MLTTSFSPVLLLRSTGNIFALSYNYGILINITKGLFGVDFLDFLGHHVEASGIQPRDDKVQAIQDFSLPSSQWKLLEFIGLVNFSSLNSS